MTRKFSSLRPLSLQELKLVYGAADDKKEPAPPPPKEPPPKVTLVAQPASHGDVQIAAAVPVTPSTFVAPTLNVNPSTGHVSRAGFQFATTEIISFE